jgi:transcriptional regulator with XRE-family HTH domain
MGVYTPKQTERFIAANLRLLMKLAKHSERDLEKISGVSQKTINNILHARGEAKIPTVEKLANAYGLRGWQLMMKTLGKEASNPGSTIGALLDAFLSANEEGQKIILGIAEREAKYAK